MKTLTQKPLVGQLVGKEHVDDLIRNYKKERWVHNSNRLGKADSLSAWFSLESLKGFLEVAREENADGIKIYFGAYPENFEKKPEYSGRQTVVLVATKEKHTSEGKTINKDIYRHKDGKTDILAFNFSALCPPNCGSNEDQGGMDLETIGITIFENNAGLNIV
jgi:hypothetical protein